jgi:hypothetical protein
MQRQLEAAAEANNPDVMIRRLTHAIQTASDAGVEDLSIYQDELAAIQNKASLAAQQQGQGLLSLAPGGAAPALKVITPRRLPATPAEVRARIEAGDVASLVGILTLTDDGVAELRDAAEPAKGAVCSAKVFDPSQLAPGCNHAVLRCGGGNFNHLALRDMLEDPGLPFARVVAAIDPMFIGSQLLASQLLRHGPQLPLNSVVCALPGQTTAGGVAGPDLLPVIASLCLGGDALGMGLSTSGCVFGRALAIVERGTALQDRWPDSIASVALQVASLGTQVEERPASQGQWLFHPPGVVEEPVPSPGPPADGQGEPGEGEAEPAAPVDGDADESEKPPEPEKASQTGVNVHAWLFNGLNQCYANGSWSQLSGQGVSDVEAKGCKEWLAKTEKAGFWGPVVGVREETLRLQEEERMAREEAKREAKRQAKAEKKRLAEEAAAQEAAAAEAAAAAEGEPPQ